MLSVSKMSGSKGEYYVGLATEDYYSEGGEAPGFWTGAGAKQLGLTGQINNEQFLQIYSGFSADGKKSLVQNAGAKKRVGGWDLTFSAPKSVSALWSQLGKKHGEEIRAAHTQAVLKAIEYLQKEAGITRTGKAGLQKEAAKLVVGMFEHGTSRAADPQLHTHALFLNLTVGKDGMTRTLDSRNLYRFKMTAGAIYRAELAYGLNKRLGLTCEKKRSWFELKGVSKKLIDDFSKRRKAIEKFADEKGLSSARQFEYAALKTRDVKGHVARKQLYEEWQKRGKELGFGREQAEKLLGQSIIKNLGRDSEGGAWFAVDKAVAEITAQSSYFSESDLIRKTAEYAPMYSSSADRVFSVSSEFLENAVKLGQDPKTGEQVFTTKEIIKLEEDLMKAVDDLSKNQQEGADENKRDGILTNSILNDEQKEAVRLITGKGKISAVAGLAGTGKTTMLKAAKKVWEKSGYRVLGASLAGKAADGLQEGAGIKSRTIARLLIDLENGKEKLDYKTILVIDEAGMIGSRQMKDIVDKVKKTGAKLVLVGDAKQLQPLAAGGAFAAITQKVKTATLVAIRRQLDDWHKKAVGNMARGKAGEALKEFKERGFLHAAKDKQGAIDKLIAKWKEQGMLKPQENLILSSTNKDAVSLNRKIQAERVQAKILKEDSYIEIEGEKFFEKDRVIFTKNSNPYRVKNGMTGTVERFYENGRQNLVSIKLDNGKFVSIPYETYQDIKLGYAATTHKAQGMTTQNTYVLTDESMQDKELSYVQTSRARNKTQIFTTEDELGENMKNLSKTMTKSKQKLMAIDFLERERVQAQEERLKLELSQKQKIQHSLAI